MTLEKILRYIRDPRAHTGPMYIVMGLTAGVCAWRARREILTEEGNEEECPYTAPSLDSPARN